MEWFGPWQVIVVIAFLYFCFEVWDAGKYDPYRKPSWDMHGPKDD